MTALRRADRDLPALTVLALLSTGPRHTYEMHRMVLATHKDFITGLPRSLYHAVDRLVRAGLVRVLATTKDSARPERTVYTLTEAGHTELSERVRRLLATPDRDATLFVAALSFLGALTAEHAAAALWDRAAALQGQLAELTDGLATVPASLPRLLLVEAEYEQRRLEAEHRYTVELAGDLDAGRLTWPTGLSESDLLPDLEEHA